MSSKPEEFTDTGIIKIQRALDGASQRPIAHFVQTWTPVEPKELVS